MTDTSPVARCSENVPAVAAAADKTTNICRVPFAATVASVTYAPDTVLTGANTESRTCSLVNKGQAGSGTTVVALKAFVSTVNAPADDETTITLSVTAADLVVTEGDILEWVSTHVGSTGLADPGGMVVVSFQRTYA
jgi:hypothetical protein